MNKSTINKRKTVLVLGATGGFGSALCPHMASSGWNVRAITRKPIATPIPTTDVDVDATNNSIEWIVANLDDPNSLDAAAEGVDVIVHAVNAPYPKWDPLMINYTRAIIELARRNNAHIIFIGNIYNAGIPADGLITEHTVHAPITEKGQVRETLENMLEEASNNGVQTTIMRFGDFFGPGIPSYNWINICTKNILKNKLTIAGPAAMPHTYAYLPDAVKAMEQVATKRLASLELPKYMVLPFTGHVFSFAQLQTTIEARTGTSMKISDMPWGAFRLLGLFVPLMRDLTSMRYLWNHNIQIDGSALKRLLGYAPEHTPLAQAVITTVPGLRQESQIYKERE